MTFEESFKLEHLYLAERKCRACGITKNLIEGFYKIRKNSYNLSSYSYECKQCAIRRVTKNREERRNKSNIPYDPVPRITDVYPDW